MTTNTIVDLKEFLVLSAVGKIDVVFIPHYKITHCVLFSFAKHIFNIKWERKNINNKTNKQTKKTTKRNTTKWARSVLFGLYLFLNQSMPKRWTFVYIVNAWLVDNYIYIYISSYSDQIFKLWRIIEKEKNRIKLRIEMKKQLKVKRERETNGSCVLYIFWT